jgi:hypothetical protein
MMQSRMTATHNGHFAIADKIAATAAATAKKTNTVSMVLPPFPVAFLIAGTSQPVYPVICPSAVGVHAQVAFVIGVGVSPFMQVRTGLAPGALWTLSK